MSRVRLALLLGVSPVAAVAILLLLPSAVAADNCSTRFDCWATAAGAASAAFGAGVVGVGALYFGGFFADPGRPPPEGFDPGALTGGGAAGGAGGGGSNVERDAFTSVPLAPGSHPKFVEGRQHEHYGTGGTVDREHWRGGPTPGIGEALRDWSLKATDPIQKWAEDVLGEQWDGSAPSSTKAEVPTLDLDDTEHA